LASSYSSRMVVLVTSFVNSSHCSVAHQRRSSATRDERERERAAGCGWCEAYEFGVHVADALEQLAGRGQTTRWRGDEVCWNRVCVCVCVWRSSARAAETRISAAYRARPRSRRPRWFPSRTLRPGNARGTLFLFNVASDEVEVSTTEADGVEV